MKIKILKAPYCLSPSQAEYTNAKHDKRRRKRCLSLSFRACMLIWVCLLVAVTYILSFVELDAVKSAFRNVRLRSSSRQHDHEDTTNSGSHDLSDEATQDADILLDRPPQDDLPSLQPLLGPPSFDVSEEERKERERLNNVSPPQVELLLVEPAIPRVAFVDTPLEERRRLLRTRKPEVKDVKYYQIKMENETKYSIYGEGLRKWEMSNVTVNWKSAWNGKMEPSTATTPSGSSGDSNLVAVTSNPATPPITKEISPHHPVKINFGYAEEVSRNINVSRNVPDGRHESCKQRLYPTNLKSSTSIIIVVYNEAWHVLLRTIHSIMERTPQHLFSELVIIDDNSDEELQYMGKELRDYVKRWEKVSVYRNDKREGLIWSRMDAATTKSFGDVIVFLDSHVEVNKGWLEPLLERIEKDLHTVAVPMLDTINPQTFQYTPVTQVPKLVDAFQWDLRAVKIPAPKPSAGGVAGPVVTPIAVRGQFAMSRKFFNMIGGFDQQLELLGGENIEISFKAWMCGGRVEIVPCSRVGHVERGRLPTLKTTDVEKRIQRNLLRVAKAWMDDHSILYENSLKSLKKMDYGDITGRIQLKKGLNCKSFDWYLKNVYPKLYDPKGKIIADAEIRSLGMDGALCLDAQSTSSAVAKMFPCHGGGGNQRWWYTNKGEIRRYDQCLDYWGNKIQFFPCHGQQGNQFWLYLSDVDKIKHVNTDKCMTVISHDTVEMEPCEEDRFNQQWTMTNFNETAYEEAGFGN